MYASDNFAKRGSSASSNPALLIFAEGNLLLSDSGTLPLYTDDAQFEMISSDHCKHTNRNIASAPTLDSHTFESTQDGRDSKFRHSLHNPPTQRRLLLQPPRRQCSGGVRDELIETAHISLSLPSRPTQEAGSIEKCIDTSCLEQIDAKELVELYKNFLLSRVHKREVDAVQGHPV